MTIEQKMALFDELVKTLRDALRTIDACGSINMEKAYELLARAEGA